MVENVVDIGFLRSDEDVTTRKTQEPIAVATFRKVEGHRALSAGTGLGGYGEAKGRCEGTSDVGEWI